MNYILFICSHNAGRSQMAQAFFNYEKKNYPLVNENYETISAGTRPGNKINPAVSIVMKEIGIDMNDRSIYFPKPLVSEFVISKGDNIKRAIIACDDSCVLPAVLPQISLERWNLPDPNKQPVEKVREVQKAVKAKVKKLLQEYDFTVFDKTISINVISNDDF